MQSRVCLATLTAATVASSLAMSVAAQELPFRAGRFLADEKEVFSGTFDRDLRIDSITVGEGMFRSSRNELLPASTVRVLVDESGMGRWRVLSERELLSGTGPVRIAHGAQQGRNVLDAFSARQLDRMFFSDGTANVRIDLLLTAGLVDSSAGISDATPEMVFAGNVSGGAARLGAIIGGNVDEPILSRRFHTVDWNMLQRSETGVSVVLNDRPASLGMFGLDLSDAFGVPANIAAIGYRLELDRGATGFFTMFGTGQADQLLGNEPSLLDEELDESLGLTGGSGGGGGYASAGAYGGGYGTFRIAGANNPNSQYAFNTSRLGFRGSGGVGGGSQFDLQAFLDFLRRQQQLQDDLLPDDDDDDDPADDGGSTGGNAGDGDGKGDDTDREPPDIGTEPKIRMGDLGDQQPRAPLDGKRLDGPLGGTIFGVPGGDEGDGSVGGNPVPAPGAMMLLGLAALTSRRRTRVEA